MELIRQEKLEQLARRFDRKAAMRETWLSENQRLVSQVLYTQTHTHTHTHTPIDRLTKIVQLIALNNR